jgi:hypothetical protein
MEQDRRKATTQQHSDSVQMGAGERREGWQRRLAPSSVRMGTGEKSSTAEGRRAVRRRGEEQHDVGEKIVTRHDPRGVPRPTRSLTQARRREMGEEGRWPPAKTREEESSAGSAERGGASAASRRPVRRGRRS